MANEKVQDTSEMKVNSVWDLSTSLRSAQDDTIKHF